MARGLRNVWVLLGLVGCPYITDADYDARFDLDGDGVSREKDCDDGDPSVGQIFRFQDADQDGHGDPDIKVAACTLVAGVADAGDDCDDTNPLVSPSAVERCNDIDDDCDGDKDEDDAIDALDWYYDGDRDGRGEFGSEPVRSCATDFVGALNATDCDDDDPFVQDLVWFEDADGDGYGSGADGASHIGCEPPEGAWTLVPGDCLDTDAEVHPEGQEVCTRSGEDVRDENCDGLVDDDDPRAVGQEVFFKDADADGRGDIQTLGWFCAAPSEDEEGNPVRWVQDDSDCDDTDPRDVDADEDECPLIDITVGDDAYCSVSSNGRMVCEGDPWIETLQPPGGFASVSAGNRHACAVDVQGELHCWGTNLAALAVLDHTTGRFNQVSIDRNHTCATRRGGEVTCWGDGISYTVAHDTQSYVAVDAGTHHACALRSDNKVDCFGSCSDAGECDEPDIEFDSVVAGDGFSCGIASATQRGVCWGARGSGALVPYTLELLAAYGDTSCALTSWGDVRCWDEDGLLFGELIDGEFARLDVGDDDGCMIDLDGEAICIDYYLESLQ
jgi:hypothetical protein